MILGISQCKENKEIEVVQHRLDYEGDTIIDYFSKSSSSGNKYANYDDYRIREAKYITDASLEIIYE
jgi:hypothetical protein